MQYYSILLCSILLFTIGACSPKTTENTEATNTSDKVIDVYKTRKLGSVKGEEYKLTMSNAALKDVFAKQFSAIKGFNDFNIRQHKSGASFYIIGNGTREGKPAVMAIELDLKGNELHIGEYNSLHISCIGVYCDNCAFKLDNKGNIADCTCNKDDITKDRKEGYSPCEQRTYIKTLEKKF